MFKQFLNEDSSRKRDHNHNNQRLNYPPIMPPMKTTKNSMSNPRDGRGFKDYGTMPSLNRTTNNWRE